MEVLVMFHWDIAGQRVREQKDRHASVPAGHRTCSQWGGQPRRPPVEW